MPSGLIAGILEVVLQVVMEVACYYIGCVVVPVISFGRLNCDPITASAPRRKFLGASFYQRRGRHIYLTAEATQLVGLLTVLLFVGGGILIWYLKQA